MSAAAPPPPVASAVSGHKPMVPASLNYLDPEIPPIAKIEGVDLVTEGVITISKVLEYAQDYLRRQRVSLQPVGLQAGRRLPDRPDAV